MVDKEAKLDQFKLDVSDDYDATETQRKAQNEDMRFISVDGGMWEGYLEQSHHNSRKARAMLEIDITSDYVMRYVGEWTLNRASVTYTPDDQATTDDDAELLSGIYRGDFKENDGQISQDTAVMETGICGVGAFKLCTKFVDEENPENEDQEIIWQPIHNAYSHVIFDENAKRADKADARHVTVLTGYKKSAFESEWPDAEPVSAYTPPSTGFSWVSGEQIYIAERYEIVTKKEIVQVWQHLGLNKVQAYNVEQFEEVKDELEGLGWEFVRERKINRQTVEKSIFTGNEFLEEPKRIAGKYLPIIPMYGYRAYIDGEEHARGLVRKLKDSNRLINSGISRMAESSASSPDSVPYFTAEQVKGKEDQLADPTAAFKVLNSIIDQQGNKIASGPLGMTQPSQIDPNTSGMIELISGFVQKTTGGTPQDTIDPQTSGKAVNALRAWENLNTQVITDNILQSIKHSGKVYRSMAADVYTRAQMKRVLGINGQSKIEQINTSSLDPQTGNPINLNDLSRGRFAVDVEVGPQYESQKEATIESIERILGQLTENSPYYAPLLSMWMENISGTGLEPLKKFNRNLMLRQGLADPESPEEQQMLQSLQQQTDPQEELVKAATNQQNAEAQNLQASSMQKIADAQLKKAQAAEKVVDIGIKQTEQTLRRLVNIQAGQPGANGAL